MTRTAAELVRDREQITHRLQQAIADFNSYPADEAQVRLLRDVCKAVRESDEIGAAIAARLLAAAHKRCTTEVSEIEADVLEATRP